MQYLVPRKNGKKNADKVTCQNFDRSDQHTCVFIHEDKINIVPSSGICGISLAVNAIICDDIVQDVYGGVTIWLVNLQGCWLQVHDVFS